MLDWFAAIGTLAAIAAVLYAWYQDRERLAAQRSADLNQRRPGVVASMASREISDVTLSDGVTVKRDVAIARVSNLGPGTATSITIRARYSTPAEPNEWAAGIVPLGQGDSVDVPVMMDEEPGTHFEGFEVQASDVEGNVYVFTTFGSVHFAVQTADEYNGGRAPAPPGIGDLPISRP